MQIKAIVFDFDGVCLDTETARFQSWQQIYTSFGVELPLEEWIKNIGRATYESDPYPYLEKVVGRTLDTDAIHARHKKNEVEIANKMALQPGFLDRLTEATALKIPCAIASSSSHRWVEGHLAYRNIQHLFSAIICREDTDTHKPDPAPYRAALERLGVNPHESVAVEDSPPGVTSACAAGMYTIAVPCSMTAAMNFDHALKRVSSLEEVSWASFALPEET